MEDTNQPMIEGNVVFIETKGDKEAKLRIELFPTMQELRTGIANYYATLSEEEQKVGSPAEMYCLCLAIHLAMRHALMLDDLASEQAFEKLLVPKQS